MSRLPRLGTRASRLPGIVVVAAFMLTACTRETGLVRVQRDQLANGVRLILVAAPGARINARLKPALELNQGGLVRFDSPALTADSAYFAAPPSATVTPASRAHGLLRVSVCPRNERLCRTWTRQI